MPRDRDDLKVVVKVVTLGEGFTDVADLGHRWRLFLMHMERRAERLGAQSQAGKASWWFKY